MKYSKSSLIYVFFFTIFSLGLFISSLSMAQDTTDGLPPVAPPELVPGSAILQPVIGYSVQSDGDGHLYEIDLTTGVATDLGVLDFSDAEGVACIGDQLFALGGSEPFWNITTPPGYFIGNTGPRDGCDAGLGYDLVSATMYNFNTCGFPSSLYTINVVTGSATFVGNGADFCDNIAFNGQGVAYCADFIFNQALYTVNLATGATTLVGGMGTQEGANAGLDFDASGTLWAVTDTGNIYTINPTTGAATFIVGTLGGFEGLAICGGASDLIVSSLSAGIRTFGTPMIRGVFANYMVTNEGSGDAVSSCLDFYLSRDAVIDPGDVYLGRENIPGLAAGNSYGSFKDFRRSFDNWQPASGTWRVIAEADACDDNEESDETNNQTSTVAAIVK